MDKNKYLLFIVGLLFTMPVFAQAEKIISGRIIVTDATPMGVHIINLVNEKEVISDKDGVFSILAKPDDLLVFSAIELDYMRKILDLKDYNSGYIVVTMTSKINQLEEVEVTDNKNINAVNLGIISKPIKSLTAGERRLKTATDLDLSLNAGTMMGGSIGLDPLINWLSGRTKLLKQELALERKEKILKITAALYTTEYYTDTLKIPVDYIKAFQYYCIENEDFVTALATRKSALVSFVMIDLATKYKNLLVDDKK